MKHWRLRVFKSDLSEMLEFSDHFHELHFLVSSGGCPGEQIVGDFVVCFCCCFCFRRSA